MRGFWLSLGLTFWAEMGDKTQLLVLAFATRYTLRHVLIGVAWATVAISLFSVGVGRLIAAWIPIGYVQLLAALGFLAFAIWTWREDDEGDDEASPTTTREGLHPILLIGLIFFAAEFGDKTMLAAVTLATTWNWFAVWIATILGMTAADGLAAWIGSRFGKSIPKRLIKGVAIVLFLAFAAWSARNAWNSFHALTTETTR